MATIKDIAKRLNISVSTVSYALNGGPRTVPDAVRERVLETAKELDYRPNRLARSLATGRSHTIGVVPTEPIRDLASMNFFSAVFNGIVNAAEDLDHDVIVFTRADASRSTGLDVLLDGRADGLVVLSPRLPSSLLDGLVNAGLPFAVVASAAPEGFPEFCCDNAAGVDLAVDYLVSLGHRRIGHLAGPANLYDGVLRQRAFCEAMARHNLSIPHAWIQNGGFTIEGGEAATAQILDSGEVPTALFAANDESAVGAIQCAVARGSRVPEDLSIVGFDDARFASYLTPALTTVEQPFDAMGADALRSVVDLIEGRPAVSQSYSPRLLPRSSTAPPSNEGK